MSEIKTIITEQLQQLQILMHRNPFTNYMGNGKARSPHRGQGRVLALLKIKPEISQRDLTYLLGMSKQAIAELLIKLEKNGYITKQQSETDKRVLIIRLTDEGEKAAENVEARESETPEFLDCLNDEELTTFSGYLERIIKRCEEQFPGEDFEQRQKAMREFMSQHDRHRGCHGHHGARSTRGFDEPFDGRAKKDDTL